MIFAIIYAIFVLFVGSIFYLLMFQPFEGVQNAMEPILSGITGGSNAQTLLNNAWVWFPIIGLVLPIVIWLIIRFMEEQKTGGYSYSGV